MDLHTKMAIVAISLVIPLSIVAVYGTDSVNTFEQNPTLKLNVISSFYPLHEFSQQVGKEKIESVLLVPAGVEPHDWEPTIKDVQRMQNADLIIINGLGFENWVDDIKINNFNGNIVDTSAGIPIKNLGLDDGKEDHDEHTSEEDHDEHTSEEDHDEHNHGNNDPHIWLNPIYAKIQVQNIANAFSKADPSNKEFYQSNAFEYIKELELLDKKIKNELSSCRSDFIAFHDAFSYFADHYGLHQHTIISSTNPHGDVTAKTLENIISKAQELNQKVIFSEESVNQKTSLIIANEIGGKVLILSPIEIASDGTYISKMYQNLENLKEALC